MASTLVIVCLSLPLFFSGCNGEETYWENYWFTDPPEIFHTNDAEQAQGEIPFTLILPKYLPDDVPSIPYMIEGPIRGTCPEDEILIRVTYLANYEGGPSIYIDELNSEVTQYPSSESSTYLNIAGIKVLEEETGAFVIYPSGDDEYEQGLSYSWNRNGVHFDVDVFGCDRDEARRIVESMIEQVE